MIKFNTIAQAKAYLKENGFASKIIYGDDGKLWIAESFRATKALIAAGYDYV